MDSSRSSLDMPHEPATTASNSALDQVGLSVDKLVQPTTVQSLQYQTSQDQQQVRRSPLTLQAGISIGSASGGNNGGDTESEKSGHTSSLSKKAKTRSNQSNQQRRSSEWEILEGLKEGQKYEVTPAKFEGFLLKRRKWPLKGWHKRYFSLEKGILNYSKTVAEMAKGKIHGSVDVGLSVISTKFSSKRIDIDAEEFIYHIKSKNKAQFVPWVAQLRQHRLYRQHEISYGNRISYVLPHTNSRYAVVGITSSMPNHHNQQQAHSDPSHSKVANWIIGSNHMTLDDVSKELNDFQVKLVELSSLLQVIELHAGIRKERIPDVETGSLKKYKRRFLLRRHKKTPSASGSSVVTGTTPIVTPLSSTSSGHKSLLSKATHGFRSDPVSSSTPVQELHTVKSDSALSFANQQHNQFLSSDPPEQCPTSAGGPAGQATASAAGGGTLNMTRSYTEVGKDATSSAGESASGSTGNIHQASGGSSHNGATSADSKTTLEDFLNLASEVHSGLRSCLRTMQTDREVSKQMQRSPTFEVDSLMANKVIASLQGSLHQALDENAALKSKLVRIHTESATAATVVANSSSRGPTNSGTRLTNDSNNNTSTNGQVPLMSGSVTASATPLTLDARSGSVSSAGQATLVASSTLNADGDTTTTTEDDETTTEEEVDEPTLVHQPIGNSKSYESCSVLSISEYFDAAERLSTCSTSTEDEDDGSCATDLSGDDGVDQANPQELKHLSSATGPFAGTGRRSKLPCPKPDGGDVSLWSLLCKNIGKDLSKISMPVTLNEPLGMLQRLCEELEYSELLDKAASIDDPCERLVYVAAFSVSAYGAACYRAGHKPFNPLLGETYECVREDKGFRFVSEQVSHHPPVSACHAESETFVFWQDMRIKSKFWGKSMEIIPFGNVHLKLNLRTSNSSNSSLPTSGSGGSGSSSKANVAQYRWNKVTTCVHNIFKGQRWVDQYGEMIIVDETSGLKCSLTFLKASYWSNKKHEVFGVITNSSGEVLEHLFGKWDEALWAGVAPTARCVWRPGAMPDDNQRYYGFSRFAIELNELTSNLVGVLPPTDTRFRPDQRLLEEGLIQAAENSKSRLENMQREKRRSRELDGLEYEPRWFTHDLKDGEETWSFAGEYWRLRDRKAFAQIPFDNLWPVE